MDSSPKRTRRFHSVDFKRQVVDACRQPGASIAAVALAHGINANLARRWLRESGSVSASRYPAVETIDF
uniref:transposase n=4 Tax=Methyloterricola oryzae TaxID=1495050 RepID=UPI0005EBCD1B